MHPKRCSVLRGLVLFILFFFVKKEKKKEKKLNPPSNGCNTICQIFLQFSSCHLCPPGFWKAPLPVLPWLPRPFGLVSSSPFWTLQNERTRVFGLSGSPLPTTSHFWWYEFQMHRTIDAHGWRGIRLNSFILVLNWYSGSKFPSFRYNLFPISNKGIRYFKFNHILKPHFDLTLIFDYFCLIN